jgi:hypothetical protein
MPGTVLGDGVPALAAAVVALTWQRLVVTQLHGLIPNAMPEVIPVAKPGTDRFVIVLRVDADAELRRDAKHA